MFIYREFDLKKAAFRSSNDYSCLQLKEMQLFRQRLGGYRNLINCKRYKCYKYNWGSDILASGFKLFLVNIKVNKRFCDNHLNLDNLI